MLYVVIGLVCVLAGLGLARFCHFNRLDDPGYSNSCPEPPQLTRDELIAIAREAQGTRGLTDVERRALGALLSDALPGTYGRR